MLPSVSLQSKKKGNRGNAFKVASSTTFQTELVDKQKYIC